MRVSSICVRASVPSDDGGLVSANKRIRDWTCTRLHSLTAFAFAATIERTRSRSNQLRENYKRLPPLQEKIARVAESLLILTNYNYSFEISIDFFLRTIILIPSVE